MNEHEREVLKAFVKRASTSELDHLHRYIGRLLAVKRLEEAHVKWCEENPHVVLLTEEEVDADFAEMKAERIAKREAEIAERNASLAA
jgi:hypothetical protein